MSDTAVRETRYLPDVSTGLAFRAAEGAAGPGTIRWLAPVFEVLSEDFGGFRELVLPSACTRTMGRPVQIAQYNHTTLLASRRGGTLRAAVTAAGCEFEADLADTATGQHVAVMADRGDLTGASFSFMVKSPSYWASFANLRDEGIAGTPITMRVGDQDMDGAVADDCLIRVFTEIAIYESGPVDMPAFPESVVSRARAGAAAELAGQRGLPAGELIAAMQSRSLGEVLAPRKGRSTTVARELARPRYAAAR